MHQWEIVTDVVWASGFGSRTDRMPVPGGWLYRETVFPYNEGASATVSLCFVPAPGVQ